MASPTVAANAYAALARMTSSAGAAKGAETGGQSFGTARGMDPGGQSFGIMLKDALSSVMEAGRKSDAQTVSMANGKANVMDVVTAVAETDVAVSTLVSVRDRMIQSYEDIMKMPI